MTHTRSAIIIVLTLCLLVPLGACSRHQGSYTPAQAVAPSGPSVPAQAPRPAAADTARGTAATAPRPASDGELERYAAREKQATGLDRFVGGRGQEMTIVIVLLVVILVVILI